MEEVTITVNGSAVKIHPYDGGSLVVTLNGGKPFFNMENLSAETFEKYSELDDLGRVGQARACFGPETFDNSERGSLGVYKPSGWIQNKYPGVVDCEPPYLYNRSHLLMRKLGGNDSEKNLMTGTHCFNHEEGMLSLEMEVLDYISRTGNHCYISVLPIYKGNNLLANGIIYEAKSVEDDGLSICSFVYNAEPGIVIDYTTGENWEG